MIFAPLKREKQLRYLRPSICLCPADVVNITPAPCCVTTCMSNTRVSFRRVFLDMRKKFELFQTEGTKRARAVIDPRWGARARLQRRGVLSADIRSLVLIV